MLGEGQFGRLTTGSMKKKTTTKRQPPPTTKPAQTTAKVAKSRGSKRGK